MISLMPDVSHLSIRWSAYEHEHVERAGDWFWALGIIATALSLTSILFGNVLFAILILVAAVTIGIIARMPPEIHEFEISDRGISIGDTVHPYDSIIAFWVEDSGDEPLLLVDTVKFMTPNLVIPLDGVSVEGVRSFLQGHAAEQPMKEPLAHKILEFFGF